jgi:hypothetical protein
MMGLRKPVVVAAWAWLVLVSACGGADGGGGNGDSRGDQPSLAGSRAPTIPGSGAGSGAAGAPDFGNGSEMMTMTRAPNMMYDAGVNTTTNPDEVKCGGAKFTPMIEKTVVPGNILLVADKSGSMDDPFPATGVQKGQEARTAIANAIDSLKDMVKVGAVFFPDPTGCTAGGDECSCHVPAFASTPPQIAFTPGPAFLTTWNTAYFPINNGNTPLSEGLQAADKALADNPRR